MISFNESQYDKQHRSHRNKPAEWKELNTLYRSQGMTQHRSTRLANEAEDHGKVYIKALIWGLKTFGDASPIRATEIETEDANNVFKRVAHVAYTNGAPTKG